MRGRGTRNGANYRVANDGSQRGGGAWKGVQHYHYTLEKKNRKLTELISRTVLTVYGYEQVRGVTLGR